MTSGKKRFLAFILIIFFFSLFYDPSFLAGHAAQKVKILFKVKIPAKLPKNGVVYLSGNLFELGKWQPDFLPLEKKGPKEYEILWELPKGKTIEFKFTLGNWKMVEKGPHGEEISNRKAYTDKSKTIYCQVASWNNLHLLKQSLPTWTGNIIPLPPFYSQEFKNYRKVWVYLPPSYYKNPRKRFEVAYFHDGNNIFNGKTSFSGIEWGVDETVEALIQQKKIKEIIVVAISNTPNRMDEYTPVKDPSYGGGQGDRYLYFLIHTIKPYIDKRFRTKKDAQNTALIGSSLGGLISLYAALKYSHVFSKIGAMSPSIWWGSRYILRAIQKVKLSPKLKIWLDMGTREGQADRNHNGILDTLDDARAMKNLLLQKGFSYSRNLAYYEDIGAQHNEYFWARRVWRPLRYFFGK